MKYSGEQYRQGLWHDRILLYNIKKFILSIYLIIQNSFGSNIQNLENVLRFFKKIAFMLTYSIHSTWHVWNYVPVAESTSSMINFQNLLVNRDIDSY